MSNTKNTSTKLLLNAEPFGFGPTAAIATFFPALRESFETLSFAGKAHTLDLQRSLPYDSVHDMSALSNSALAEVIEQYDVVLTALDFEFAGLAKSLGVKTLMYDPLTWYWATIPNIVKDVDMYIAQDFYGVRERITKEVQSFPKTVRIVPPIVSGKRERNSGTHVLLNLGGLQNPFWSEDVIVTYAERIIESVLQATQGKKLHIAASQIVARNLPQFDIKSYKRDEMYKLLASASCAFMTPGLGNIYDAAKFNIPTTWLPPANDSQGQQLQLLCQHDAVDSYVDWSHIGREINYFADQQDVLANIKQSIIQMDQDQLNKTIGHSFNVIHKYTTSATEKVLNEFGVGGAERTHEIIMEYVNNL